VARIAREAGYELPVEETAKFAAGYVPRVYRKEVIAALAPKIEERIFQSMKADQEQKRLLQSAVRAEDESITALTAEERKLARRQETAQKRLADLESRADEAGRFAKRGAARLDSADARLADIEGDIKALSDELKLAVDDAAYTKADVRNLEKELSDLRRERDAALRAKAKEPKQAPTAYDYVPRGTLPDTFNTARFMGYVAGTRGAPREPSLIQWIIDGGGVRDSGGDLRSAFGGKPPKGLIRNDADSLDKWAVRYGEQVNRSDENWEDALADYVAQAAGDKNWRPLEWREAYSFELRQRIDEYEAARSVREDMFREGLDPSDRAQVVAYLKGEDPNALPGKPARELDEEIPLDPIENYRGMDELTAGRQADLKRADRIVKTLKRRLQAKEPQEARASGRQGEAASNVKAASSRLDALMDRAEAWAAREKDFADRLEQIAQSKSASREKIESLIKQWDGDTSRAAQKALAKRAELEAQHPPGSPRLAVADDAVDLAAKRILRSDRDITDAELRSRARDVVTNLRSSPDGRLPYEWGETATKESRAFSSAGQDLPDNLKARKLPLHDSELVELGVLDNDPFRLMHAYTTSMIGQSEMGRIFKKADGTPDVSGQSAIRAINEEYERLIVNAEALRRDELIAAGYGPKAAAEKAAIDAPKIRDRLSRNNAKDVKYFAAMRDRVLGVYGLPDNPDSLFYRGASVARSFNFMSKMGTMVLSQLPDLGNAFLRYGLGRSFDVMTEKLNRATPAPVAKAERQMLRDAGLTMEVITGQRAIDLYELATDMAPKSKFERGVETSASVFGVANLSRHWDDMAQQFTGVMSIRRMMRGVEDWATTGKIDKSEGEWLASYNIGQNEARRIWAASQAGDGERWKGVLIPEGRTWADREAYDMVRFALRQMSDSAIIRPGQDRPLAASTPVGKLFFQFKNFFIAAQQRILIAGLQQADAHAAQGLFTMFVLGMMSEAMYDLARDGALRKRTPEEWAMAAFDRSGIGGWMTEGNNIAEKATRNTVGLRPALGISEPASRYQSRSAVDAVMGPTFGSASDLVKIAGSIASGDLNRGDLRSLQSQLPGQNHFLLRRIVEAMRDGVGDRLGLPPSESRRESVGLGEGLVEAAKGVGMGALAGAALATGGAAAAVAIPAVRAAARSASPPRVSLNRDGQGRIAGAESNNGLSVQRSNAGAAAGIE
jgi:hypothetical protein